MSGRTFLIAAAALAVGMPATAQERGTVEFGAFASRTDFDNSLGIDNSFGGGGRLGVFLFPRLSVEFEAGGSNAARSFGRDDVDIGILGARVTGVPFKIGPLSALLGAGVSHSDNHFLETGGEHGNGTAHGQSYGFDGLVGAKLGITDNLALRADWIESVMFNGGDRRQGLHLGLSVYRNPRVRTETVTRTLTERPTQWTDSVSAAETRRLRAAEARLLALRDSLARLPDRTSAEGLETMQERIHFAHDRSDLDGAARAILRDKVSVFRANPTMRIVIVGHASQRGTTSYNMALGLRRAEAAKAYLISQGIEATRVQIATQGEGELLIEGPGEAADAANRRGEFRLQLSEAPPPQGD